MIYFPYRSPFELRSSSVHPPFILRSSSVHPPFELRSSSVRAPFKLRSSSVQAPFILRSSSVHPPFELRSSSVHSPFGLRSSFVQAPFILRSGIEDWSKINRRTNGESSEAKRRCIETLMGSQGKDNLKKRPKSPINLMLPISRKKLWKNFQCEKPWKSTPYPKSPKFLQKNFAKHLVIIEKRRTFALANQK